MKTSHTPGPWCIGDSDLPVSQMAVMQAEPTRKHSTIARMSKGVQSFEEISANLKLISAAPDLLSLHKKHMELMMEIAQELKNPRLPLQTTVSASIRMLAEAAKESLAAIAKATGESA